MAKAKAWASSHAKPPPTNVALLLRHNIPNSDTPPLLGKPCAQLVGQGEKRLDLGGGCSIAMRSNVFKGAPQQPPQTESIESSAPPQQAATLRTSVHACPSVPHLGKGHDHCRRRKGDGKGKSMRKYACSTPQRI